MNEEDELARDVEARCRNNQSEQEAVTTANETETTALPQNTSQENESVSLFPMDCSDIVVGSVKGELNSGLNL